MGGVKLGASVKRSKSLLASWTRSSTTTQQLSAILRAFERPFRGRAGTPGPVWVVRSEPQSGRHKEPEAEVRMSIPRTQMADALRS